MVASSDAVANWVALGGFAILGLGAWRDIRKQTIAGSLPTEYTTTLQDRVKHLEERLDAKEARFEVYARDSRNWFYAATAAAAKGEPLPAPPPNWP